MLATAQMMVVSNFQVQTISKEELRKWSVAVQVKGEAIKQMEAGKEEEEDSDNDGVVFVGMGSQKRKVPDGDNDDKDNDGKEEITAKKPPFEEGGLLDFEGPVSCSIFFFVFFFVA